MIAIRERCWQCALMLLPLDADTSPVPKIAEAETAPLAICRCALKVLEDN